MNTTRKRKAKNRLLKRRLKNGLRRIAKHYSDSVDRQIAYARLRQRYFVAHDYSVQPFEPPLIEKEEKDPYEGQDLVNLDVMEDDV